MIETRIWAEVGQWQRGEHALVVMRGAFEDGQMIDSPEMLHDVSLPAWPADREPIGDDWDGPLLTLGYRMAPGATVGYTGYGVVFDVEEWTV